MYDVPIVALVDEDVDINDMAFQEVFQSGDHVLQHKSEGVSVTLNKEDIESIYFDASAIICPLQLRHSYSTLIMMMKMKP